MPAALYSSALADSWRNFLGCFTHTFVLDRHSCVFGTFEFMLNFFLPPLYPVHRSLLVEAFLFVTRPKLPQETSCAQSTRCTGTSLYCVVHTLSYLLVLYDTFWSFLGLFSTFWYSMMLFGTWCTLCNQEDAILNIIIILKWGPFYNEVNSRIALSVSSFVRDKNSASQTWIILLCKGHTASMTKGPKWEVVTHQSVIIIIFVW